MQHSYLLIGCIATAAGFLSVYLSGDNRRLVLASGLLAAPAGLADLIFVPEYWRPTHMIGPWLSLEGLLFSFGNGCLVMALVQSRMPSSSLGISLELARPIKRLTVVMLIGFGVFLTFWQGAAGWLMIMHATFVGFAAMVFFLYRRGSFSHWIAAVGGAGYCLIYGVEIALWYWIDPDFKAFWTSQSDYWMVMSFPPGMPIEEFVWSFAYGSLWSNLMLYGFRVDQLRPIAVR